MARDSCWDVHENNENCSCAFLPSSPFLRTLLSFPPSAERADDSSETLCRVEEEKSGINASACLRADMRKHYSPAGEAFQNNVSASNIFCAGCLWCRGCSPGFIASTSQVARIQSCGAKTSSISRPTKPDLSSLTRSLSEECPLGLLALRIA